jgi:hypothetical protein
MAFPVFLRISRRLVPGAWAWVVWPIALSQPLMTLNEPQGALSKAQNNDIKK